MFRHGAEESIWASLDAANIYHGPVVSPLVRVQLVPTFHTHWWGGSMQGASISALERGGHYSVAVSGILRRHSLIHPKALSTIHIAGRSLQTFELCADCQPRIWPRQRLWALSSSRCSQTGQKAHWGCSQGWSKQAQWFWWVCTHVVGWLHLQRATALVLRLRRSTLLLAASADKLNLNTICPVLSRWLFHFFSHYLPWTLGKMSPCLTNMFRMGGKQKRHVSNEDQMKWPPCGWASTHQLDIVIPRLPIRDPSLQAEEYDSMTKQNKLTKAMGRSSCEGWLLTDQRGRGVVLSSLGARF